jgi:hypothetical protein
MQNKFDLSIRIYNTIAINMSQTLCNICQRDFKSVAGLNKHKNRKIPCKPPVADTRKVAPVINIYQNRPKSHDEPPFLLSPSQFSFASEEAHVDENSRWQDYKDYKEIPQEYEYKEHKEISQEYQYKETQTPKKQNYDFITKDVMKEMFACDSIDGKKEIEMQKNNPNMTQDEEFEMIIRRDEPNWDGSKREERFEELSDLKSAFDKITGKMSIMELLGMLNPETADNILEANGVNVYKIKSQATKHSFKNASK